MGLTKCEEDFLSALRKERASKCGCPTCIYLAQLSLPELAEHNEYFGAFAAYRLDAALWREQRGAR
jgi:hypothetical protein